jgi:hypothetical protein
MTIDLQQKIHWLEQVSSTFASLINNQNKTEGVPEVGNKEVALLGEELLQWFNWITQDLKKLHPSAAFEFNNWMIQQDNSFDRLFQFEPNVFENGSWEPISQIQQLISQKYIHYFYFVGIHLYHAKEMIKADRIFRLLTLIYPQQADYWIWLGVTQQQRHLPELALVSNMFASLLDNRNPYPFYYMAQCWAKLKKWDQAKSNLSECLNKIGENASFQDLKAKCQEIQESMLAAPQDSLFADVIFQKKALHPSEAINNLYLDQPLVVNSHSDCAKALLEEFKKKHADLAEQLNGIEEPFKHEVNTLDFFEKRTFLFEKTTVKIPVLSFFQIYPSALGLLFGELVTAASIAKEKKEEREAIQTNNSFRIANTFASIFDHNEPPSKKTINKYVYFYEKRLDLVLNREVINPEYGSSKEPYQENYREDNRIRASLFHREDIVGKSILDCGCNEGGILFACRNLGAKTITGFDTDSWCIDHANKVVSSQNITDAKFHVGDMENRAFLSTLPMSDTVLLLAVLDTSVFVSKMSVIANLSRFAKHTLYYEGHATPESHVLRMYELLIATDFTRFEYLGRFANRILIRCTRDLMEISQLPPGAITSVEDNITLLNASEIYLFTDSPKNPPFSSKCRLIQFVKKG